MKRKWESRFGELGLVNLVEALHLNELAFHDFLTLSIGDDIHRFLDAVEVFVVAVNFLHANVVHSFVQSCVLGAEEQTTRFVEIKANLVMAFGGHLNADNGSAVSLALAEAS